MELSKRHKEIIKLMRQGINIEVKISEGRKANKYSFSTGVKQIRKRPIIDLWDEKILQHKSINAFTFEFHLTELGKTINID